MVWLPDGEKNYDMFIRFDRIHERDGHTDRRTDGQTDTAWRHRPRCIASRGKNYVPWNAVSCPITEIPWKTASHAKFHWNRAVGCWVTAKKQHLKKRTSVILNFKDVHIWSSGCYRVPNLLLCTKFHQKSDDFSLIWRFNDLQYSGHQPSWIL